MKTGQSLQYAAAPGRSARRLRRRSVAAGGTLIGLGCAIWWGPATWRSTRLQYDWVRCENYTPRSGSVVYDRRPGTGIVPDAWSQFYALFSPPGLKSDGTVFLHRLIDPAGNWLLVAIDIDAQSMTTATVRARVFVPGRWVAPPREVSNDATRYTFSIPADARVLAGQVDPADPSRFGFTVVSPNQQRRHFEGFLTSDDRCVIRPSTR